MTQPYTRRGDAEIQYSNPRRSNVIRIPAGRPQKIYKELEVVAVWLKLSKTGGVAWFDKKMTGGSVRSRLGTGEEFVDGGWIRRTAPGCSR
jgi:hypothetical protein